MKRTNRPQIIIECKTSAERNAVVLKAREKYHACMFPIFLEVWRSPTLGIRITRGKNGYVDSGYTHFSYYGKNYNGLPTRFMSAEEFLKD